MMEEEKVNEQIKKLETEIRSLKRQNLELTRVYTERGKQIERLEIALTRALKGSK